VGTIEERVARLERFLGLGQGEAKPADREQLYGGDRLKVGDWLESRRRPNERLSVLVLMLEEFSISSVLAAMPDERMRWDPGVLNKTASICEALASEVRLSILQELFEGPKSTAELLKAVSMDRGQLYHHLRDLFVQGFVSQPERGRYEATTHGRMMLLAVGQLAYVGPESIRTTGDIDMDDEAAETA
jgi:DNA-binding transcriptional ArsR family regulator